MTNRTVAKYDFALAKEKHSDLWKPIQKMKPMKRSRDDNLIEEEYVSGTTIKNYLLRDPILDWFDRYYESIGINSGPQTKAKKRKLEENIRQERDKLNILFDGGNEFENKVMDYLNRHFDGEIITINTDGQDGSTQQNFKKTIKAMKNGIPIIAQGVLFNEDNKTRGIADLIVRSDYLNKLVKRRVLTEEKECIKAPNLNGNYHYRVIDIKWTSMTLCANGYTIRNDGRFPCYKGQLAIYNCAIGRIQGYYPPETYIMAKGWKIDKKNNIQEGFDCFDLLGVIDYDGFDYQFIDKTKNAITWIKDLRQNGMTWDLHKPTREEMYPNSSNNNDAPWTKVKKQLCKSIDEITQIWFVTDQHRKNAHDKGIMSWKDERCTSSTLEISGELKPIIIDAILDINRNPNGKIEPKIIKNNLMNWQKESPVDFYVDFETVNGCFFNPEIDIQHSKTDSDIVFMIGVGYIENNTWCYKVFTTNDLSMLEECRIFDEFTDFITEKTRQFDPKSEFIPRLFHWSPAEVTNFRHVNMRHSEKWIEWEKNILWTDMYYVFTNEPIVVKGALNFRLKEIGKAMYNLGFVTTLWDDNGPSDGLAAMIDAVKYYKNKSNNLKLLTDDVMFKAVIDYNEIDCKVIWEIVSYLRKRNVR
jgi:hypothetical protein